MFKKLFILFFVFSNMIAVKFIAQDLTFSQFYEQPLLRNPALAGVFTGDLKVAMAYRDQWSSFTIPFRTAALSVEHKIPVGSGNDILAIGAQFTLDAAGDLQLKRTQLLPAISFHKSLNENKDDYLAIGFIGGPVYSQFDATLLKMGDQYQNGSYNPSNPTMQPITGSGYSYWDLGTGLCFSSSFNENGRMYVGASMLHVTNPTIHSVTGRVDDFLKPRYSVNFGLNTPIADDNNRLFVFADYIAQNGNRQLLGGLLYGWNIKKYYEDDTPVTFYVGSFLRWGDALIPTVKLDMNHFTVGISYDVNISKLNVASNWRGGLELTASYSGFLQIKNSTIDKLRCVKF
jgi:type IX secretion system PorP/SprF family membrane protein